MIYLLGKPPGSSWEGFPGFWRWFASTALGTLLTFKTSCRLLEVLDWNVRPYISWDYPYHGFVQAWRNSIVAFHVCIGFPSHNRYRRFDDIWFFASFKWILANNFQRITIDIFPQVCRNMWHSPKSHGLLWFPPWESQFCGTWSKMVRFRRTWSWRTSGGQMWRPTPNWKSFSWRLQLVCHWGNVKYQKKIMKITLQRGVFQWFLSFPSPVYRDTIIHTWWWFTQQPERT